MPKHPQPADRPTTLFDLPQLCFLGSSVVSGSGTAVVVATGADTYFGAAHRPTGLRRPDTSFERTARAAALTLVRFMLATVPLVLAANAALRGRGWDALPFAVAVAIGLTPEMLPAVMTTALAHGATTLRRHRVIVKRLSAIHDLGAMDILCADKTGTLTRDRLTLDRAVDRSGQPDPEVLRWAATASLIRAEIADPPVLDAFDDALLEAADHLDPQVGDGITGIAALPFDPVRRLATIVVRQPRRLGIHTLLVTGAPEDILDRCADLDDHDRKRFMALTEEHAAAGLRLLAVARADRPARTRPYGPADETGLTLLGLLCLHDEADPTAPEALADLTAHGIAVKIRRGDPGYPRDPPPARRRLGPPSRPAPLRVRGRSGRSPAARRTYRLAIVPARAGRSRGTLVCGLAAGAAPGVGHLALPLTVKHVTRAC